MRFSNNCLKVTVLLPLTILWIRVAVQLTTMSSSSLSLTAFSTSYSHQPPNDDSHKSQSFNNVITVAYVISLIKCSDFQSSTSGLLDAATILRHSIHRTSIRSPASGSKYDYKLFAIVHKQLAQQCSSVVRDLGYEIVLVDPPVQTDEIQGEYLRQHIHKEWCCGIDEFIKLYAYTFVNYPIVVHTDIDFMYYQHMDNLYDAMLLPASSIEGQLARSKIELEYPTATTTLPKNIEAFITRDYHQVIPGRKAAFQAGFIVLKPNLNTFNEYLAIIRTGNYTEGFSRNNGWGGLGYGGVVGAMAMQGLPAYYYDVIRPNTSVELNGCRYNHMGANIHYNNVPNFIPKYTDLHGKCRRNVEGCEDCQLTDISNIYNIHFTNCRKPWNCAGRSGTSKGGSEIDPRTTNYEHCMDVIHTWHVMRSDLENYIINITQGNIDEGEYDTINVHEGQAGQYKRDIFMGHCSKDGQGGYLPLAASRKVLRMVADKLWNQ